MTKEEVIKAFEVIVSKCDCVINNKNYTADDYAQDKVEDIAEICHRILDGQYGEIPESAPTEGVVFEYVLIGRNTIENLDMDALRKEGINFGDNVIVQIRKK